MAPTTGFEPATSRSTGACSSAELRRHVLAYPEHDSNVHWTGSKPAASTVGLPGHVLRGPTECRTPEGSLARRPCAPALSPWSQRGGSNSLRRDTNPVHHLSCCAGMKSQRRELNPIRPLTRRLHDRRAALACVGRWPQAVDQHRTGVRGTCRSISWVGGPPRRRVEDDHPDRDDAL
jgi:hypothetical protein